MVAGSSPAGRTNINLTTGHYSANLFQVDSQDIKYIQINNAPLAQLVEQLTLNQWVEGSIPSGRTITPPKDLLRFKFLATLFVSITILFSVYGCALWGLNCNIELV